MCSFVFFMSHISLFFSQGVKRYINVYPTIQFLYSIHIQPQVSGRLFKIFRKESIISFLLKLSSLQYMTDKVRAAVSSALRGDIREVFLQHVLEQKKPEEMSSSSVDGLDISTLDRHIRQNPQFSLAALEQVDCLIIIIIIIIF